jgi:UDP-glucose 4-epimerase
MMGEKKILVTGGAGIIGSHTVVELINSGYKPIIIDDFSNSSEEVIQRLEKITSSKIQYTKADCNDSLALEKLFSSEKDIFGVIHFAAFKAVGESVLDPLKYYSNNIGSTVTLLKIMDKYKVSNFVFSSSCTVYGEPDQLPVTEQTPVKPAQSPYGNTKQICEEIITDFVASKDVFKAISLRYFNPIGAHPTGLIGELPIGVPGNLVPFVTQTAAGLREKVTVFGNTYKTPDGTCIRDYIHVVDLAKAHVKALDLLMRAKENRYYDVFNLGTGKGNSVLEIVKTFEEVNNLKLNYVIGPKREGDVEQIFASTEKANSELNWKAELSLKEALRDAWNWQQKIK